MKLLTAKTCTEAWENGMHHLLEVAQNHREYNLITQISDPYLLGEGDYGIYTIVDHHLKSIGANSLQTVINTIFPASLYLNHGSNIFEYFQNVEKTISKAKKNPWGTYALRLFREQTDFQGRKYCPLKSLILKLKAQLETPGAKKACYDINCIDPLTDLPIHINSEDHSRIMGGPCLVHLSFKLSHDNKLLLTAVYRSHYYVERTYGNFLGLAWLQRFVADQVQINTGEIVCHSTMAQLGRPVKEAQSLMKNIQRSKKVIS
mgnify:CR=1 FL=1